MPRSNEYESAPRFESRSRANPRLVGHSEVNSLDRVKSSTYELHVNKNARLESRFKRHRLSRTTDCREYSVCPQRMELPEGGCRILSGATVLTVALSA